MTFEEHVLIWLKTKHPTAVSVEGVSSWGTDWAGDTVGGFYSEFDVNIKWTDSTGKQHTTGVAGDDMGDLWDHVVNGWQTISPPPIR